MLLLTSDDDGFDVDDALDVIVDVEDDDDDDVEVDVVVVLVVWLVVASVLSVMVMITNDDDDDAVGDSKHCTVLYCAIIHGVNIYSPLYYSTVSYCYCNDD